MQRMSYAIPCLIVVVALYFAATFTREAYLIFTSPVYGLDHAAFARSVYDLGQVAGLGAAGLIRLSAFLGALKLAIAVIFVLHLVDRLRGLRTGNINHEVLDAGVVLVVISTCLSASPALIEASPEFFNAYRPALWLAGLAATLSLAERVADLEEASRLSCVVRGKPARTEATARPRSALRWDHLRRDAGRH